MLATIGALAPTLTCTSSDYLLLTLNSLLPAVAALLSATALWVAARARSTSAAARSTSLDLSNFLEKRVERRATNESDRTALAPRRTSSSTWTSGGSTSTSPGE